VSVSPLMVSTTYSTSSVRHYKKCECKQEQMGMMGLAQTCKTRSYFFDILVIWVAQKRDGQNIE
jgi:hypothetical protein